MHCKVSLLDDTVYECVVEVSPFNPGGQSAHSRLEWGCYTQGHPEGILWVEMLAVAFWK